MSIVRTECSVLIQVLNKQKHSHTHIKCTHTFFDTPIRARDRERERDTKLDGKALRHEKKGKN